MLLEVVIFKMIKLKNNFSYIIELENIHRYLNTGFSKQHVLRGISLKIQKSKIYSILGPSGCGKSTLLYILGLLDKPDKGKISIYGQQVENANDSVRTSLRKQYIGFVFQFHFLLPEFTVLENICLPMAKANILSKKDQLIRGEFLVNAVGLKDKCYHPANNLSGGERQRVAVARALANKPKIILADEPTGNLDTKNGNKIFELLFETSRKDSTSVIMVTHNEELALLCDYKMSIVDGTFIKKNKF